MRVIVIIIMLLTSQGFTQAQDNILAVSISNPQPFGGELFSYSVEFSSTLDLANAQIQLPQFVGFAQQQQQPILSSEVINGATVNVLKQEVTLYANRDEEFLIAPTTIIIPETPFQAGIQADSNTTAVNIRPLPDNAPDTFTSAVGQFDISVAIEPPIIQAGEPNLLSVSITGSGNFDQITSPSLRLPDTWEVFERPAIFAPTTQRVQTKTFQYQFFADQTGSIILPAVLFSFFDPLTNSYKTITSQELAFTVDGEFIAQNQTSADTDESRYLPLKPMSGQSSTILPATSFWILWIIPPFVVLVISLIQFISRPRQHQPRRRRKQSHTLKTAIDQLTQAQQKQPNQIYSTVEQTIIQYIAEAYQQDIDTVEQIRALIIDLPEKIRERTLVCLEQAQSGQYAPVTRDDANKLLKHTYKTLHLIEEEQS